jgi:hypothetical protein
MGVLDARCPPSLTSERVAEQHAGDERGYGDEDGDRCHVRVVRRRCAVGDVATATATTAVSSGRPRTRRRAVAGSG